MVRKKSGETGREDLEENNGRAFYQFGMDPQRLNARPCAHVFARNQPHMCLVRSLCRVYFDRVLLNCVSKSLHVHVQYVSCVWFKSF